MSTDPPRNRKERRAATRSDGDTTSPLTTKDIPMAQPDRSAPKAKTLLEIAEERRDLLSQGQPFSKSSNNNSSTSSSPSDDPPIGPIGEAIFTTTSLAMLHFTLDVLVYHQYRQTIEWHAIIKRTLTMLPVLFTVIYVLHSKLAMRFAILRQVFWFAVAVGAGCYVIYAGNKYTYFAVMKRAPSLGTLWVWSVVEMRLEVAVLSLVVDAGYMWWNGFTVF